MIFGTNRNPLKSQNLWKTIRIIVLFAIQGKNQTHWNHRIIGKPLGLQYFCIFCAQLQNPQILMWNPLRLLVLFARGARKIACSTNPLFHLCFLRKPISDFLFFLMLNKISLARDSFYSLTCPPNLTRFLRRFRDARCRNNPPPSINKIFDPISTPCEMKGGEVISIQRELSNLGLRSMCPTLD